MKITRPKVYLAGFWTEDLGELTPDLGIVGEAWTVPGWRINSHAHPDWEFKLQVSGTSNWIFDGKPLVLEENTLYAVAPGVVHEPQPTKMSTHFLFCRINLEAALARNPAIRAEWMNKRFFRLGNALALKPTLQKLIREATTPSAARLSIARALIDLFLLELTRSEKCGDVAGADVRRHKGVARAIEILDRDYHKNRTIGALAKLAGVSAGHFGKLFFEETMCSPRDYRMGKRIDAAKDILAHTDRSITDVALDLGFASGQHFAREFKIRCKMTPRDYRQRLLRS